MQDSGDGGVAESKTIEDLLAILLALARGDTDGARDKLMQAVSSRMEDSLIEYLQEHNPSVDSEKLREVREATQALGKQFCRSVGLGT